MTQFSLLGSPESCIRMRYHSIQVQSSKAMKFWMCSFSSSIHLPNRQFKQDRIKLWSFILVAFLSLWSGYPHIRYAKMCVLCALRLEWKKRFSNLEKQTTYFVTIRNYFWMVYPHNEKWDLGLFLEPIYSGNHGVV
jgi:hypothetical protein